MELIMAGLSGLVVGVLITIVIQNITQKLTEVANRNKELQQQLEELQNTKSGVRQRVRQTGATMAGLEDAMASLIDLQVNRQIEQERIDAAIRTLQQLRKGPYEYKEQPNNRREFR